MNEEIRSFVALGRAAHIFCLIVDGEPHAADPAEECFPPALFEDGHHEPLASDVRPGGDGKKAARLKILAGLLGVGFDELRQRDAARRQHQLTIIAAASTLGLIFTAALAVFAFLSRSEAIRERDIANRKTMTAERTVSFVKSLFEVSDPSEARGQTITAREILDRGAREIRTGLQNEPAVKAELGTTLGEVYSELGLYREGDQLIREMAEIRHNDVATRTRQLLALADAQTRQADYDAAIRSYDQALRLARDRRQPRQDLVPRILVGLGGALSAKGDYRGAERAIDAGLRLDEATFGPNHPDVAVDLEAQALNYLFAGDLDRSRQGFQRAVAIRLRTQGDRHPRVPEDFSNLGAVAYLQGHVQLAEADYRRALDGYRVVLGPEHPEVATTENNLARIMIERQGFREALPLLEHAVAVNMREKGPDHDDIIFPLSNLAIAERGVGAFGKAEQLLRRAARTARLRQHRNLGPILTELADLRCRSKDDSGGLKLLDEARPITAKDYPDDPWRVAWVDNTRAYCLARTNPDEARRLNAASLPVLNAKWGPDTLYGAMARLRQRSLS